MGPSRACRAAALVCHVEHAIKLRAPHALRLQLLPQPAIFPKCTLAGPREWLAHRHAELLPVSVFPRRLHPANAGGRDLLPRTRPPFLCDPCFRAAAETPPPIGRRTKHLGRTARRHRSAPYVGVIPFSTIRTFIAWCQAAAPFARRHAPWIACPPRLLSLPVRVLSASVSRRLFPPCRPAGCIRWPPARLFRQPRGSFGGAYYLRSTRRDQLSTQRMGLLSQAAVVGPDQVLGLSRLLYPSRRHRHIRLISLSGGNVCVAWNGYRRTQDQGDDARCQRFTSAASSYIPGPDCSISSALTGFFAKGRRCRQRPLCSLPRLLYAPSWPAANSELAAGTRQRRSDRTTSVTDFLHLPRLRLARMRLHRRRSSPCIHPSKQPFHCVRHDLIAAFRRPPAAGLLRQQPHPGQLCRSLTGPAFNPEHSERGHRINLMCFSAPSTRMRGRPCQNNALHQLRSWFVTVVPPTCIRHYPR